jgi:signal transduction protein with GAF and PtsI domain
MATKKLIETLEQKEEELRILHEVAKDISGNVELGELLHRIVEMVMQFIITDSCLIYLYDKHNDELILTASSHPQSRALGRIKLKMGEGVTGWVAREKMPVALAKEAYKDPRFKTFTSLDDDKYEAFLSIPILSRTK